MNYPIDLDVTPGGVPKIVKLSQYDKSIPVIVATLWEGSQAYTMPTGATCYVAGTKPDNTGFEYQVSNSGNVVTITVTEQMTAVAGRVPTEVIIMTSGGRKGSANFFLDVEPAALSEDTSLSETDIPIIEQLPEKLEEAKTYANKAHQWATYGSDSEQPSTTNNAKYYAEQAAQVVGQATTISEETDTAPYLFRSSTANAEYDELVGVSVVENQLCTSIVATKTVNGVTFTNNGDGSITISGTASADVGSTSNGEPITNSNNIPRRGHKVLISVIDTKITGLTFGIGGYATNHPTSFVFSDDSSSDWQYGSIRVFIASGTTLNVKFTPKIIDLTLAFGSSVADLIYSMEQATEGSGIAYLKSLGLLNEDGTYNAGTMTSSQPVKRVVRGFNQWDEEWELGVYDQTTGQKASDPGTTRSKNYIRVIPNATYYVKAPQGIRVYLYDENKSYLGITQIVTAGGTLTIPNNCHYMTFIIGVKPYNHDICINISNPTKNGTYEPYKEVEYDFGSDTLRGILTLDGNNIVANGDVKTSDGVITRKYFIVNLGDLPWEAENNNVFRSMQNATVNKMKFRGNILCTKYIKGSATIVLEMVDKEIAVLNSQAVPIFRVRDTSYSDATTFKTAMDGVYALVELATPTTEQSTPFAYPQVVMETEEIVSDIPCGHNAKYVTLPTWMDKKIINDLVAEATKVADIEESLPSKVEESNIAPVENGSTASTSYPVGRLIMRNGTLYKVISSIASGGTFTVDTNIQRTTLADVIASL